MNKSNFEMFLDTVNNLRYSQGFYSRLASSIEDMDDIQKTELANYLNGLSIKFNDQLDVVMFLET